MPELKLWWGWSVKRSQQLREKRGTVLIWQDGKCKLASVGMNDQQGFFFLEGRSASLQREDSKFILDHFEVSILYPENGYLYLSRANIVLATVYGSMAKFYTVQFIKEFLTNVDIWYPSQPLSKEQEEREQGEQTRTLFFIVNQSS